MTVESNLPADPAYTEPTEELIEQLADNIGQLALEFAREVVIRIEGLPEPGRLRTLDQVEAMGRRTDLAMLRMLREIGPAVEQIAGKVAKSAGRRGATYPQLGLAWGVTRQAARSRWPGVVKAGNPRPPVTVAVGGGTANISWVPEDDGWCWRANAANGEHRQTEAEYSSSEEAAAHAGAFLVANSL